MSSVNITIEHNELAHNADVSDQAPYMVSAWFIDRAQGTMVTAERAGINPVQLFGEVLAELTERKHAGAESDEKIGTCDMCGAKSVTLVRVNDSRYGYDTGEWCCELGCIIEEER